MSLSDRAGAFPRLAMLVVAALLTAPAAAQTLKFRFIGNQAFEISDGEVTLLSDFPYQSGYSIYMTYPEEELRPRRESVCLITHKHGDHFDPVLVTQVGCTVVAPRELTRELEGVPVLELEPEIRFRSLRIVPIRTPHASIEHYSYLVEWHGRRLYFVGDTETPEHIEQDLDVLFVTPWLARSLQRSGRDLPAELNVVYHHTADEEVDCQGCLVPRQGQTFVLEKAAEEAGGSEPPEPVRDSELRRELLAMGRADQELRGRIHALTSEKGPGDPRVRDLWEAQNAIDQRNRSRLVEILERHGWPGRDLVGVEASRQAFLILQHAPLQLQKTYFDVARQAARLGDIEPSDVAMLEDRILMREGKKQLYGTQLTWNEDTGRFELHPIADEADVDRRRAAVGLPPLAEYLRRVEAAAAGGDEGAGDSGAD